MLVQSPAGALCRAGKRRGLAQQEQSGALSSGHARVIVSDASSRWQCGGRMPTHSIGVRMWLRVPCSLGNPVFEFASAVTFVHFASDHWKATHTHDCLPCRYIDSGSHPDGAVNADGPGCCYMLVVAHILAKLWRATRAIDHSSRFWQNFRALCAPTHFGSNF